MTYPFVGTHSASEWAEWGGQNHAIVEDAVTLETADRRHYTSPTTLVAEPPLPFTVVDLDVDDCGDIWLLTSKGTLHRYDPERDDLRRIHCTWDEPPAAPSAVAVTADTVYVAIGAPEDSASPGGSTPSSGDSTSASDGSTSTSDSSTSASDGSTSTSDGSSSASDSSTSTSDGSTSPSGDSAGGPAGRALGGRIHAFSRHLMQTRWIAHRGYENPVAMARRGETVSVLDDGADDPFVAVVGHDGDPIDAVTGFRAPIDLAVDEDGDRYVLDRDPGGGNPTVERLPAGETASQTAIPSAQFVVSEDGSAISPEFLSAGLPGEVIVGDADAEATTPSLFRYEPARGSFDRLLAYSGPVAGLLLRRGDADGADAMYVVGDNGTALSTLPATERYRINPDTGRYDGQVVRRLDAGERGMQWHRITLSLETPAPGTQVRVSYHATDEAAVEFREPGTGPVTPLEDVDGIGPILADRLRGSYVRGLRELIQLDPERVAEIATHEDYHVSPSRAASWIAEARAIVAGLDGPGDLDWQSVGQPNPEDALLTDAEGRYLWVKVELVGTPSAAPRVESLRAYFPRQSYLRYLPAVYQDDPASAEFLERYLSLFESVFTGVEEEISAATRFIDPEGVPSEALSWLAGWLALSPDETWSTASKRTLVRRAHELFKARGTRAGLRELLAIYLADRAERPSAWQWAIDRQREAIDERLADIDDREAAGDLDPATAERMRDRLERHRARLDRTLFVWEQSDLDCIETPVVRELYERLLPCPQCFAVLLWPSLSAATVREAQRLVETTRPAHAVGRAVRLQPWIQLAGTASDRGHHTYLGVNSALADREFVVASSGLGLDTELTEHEPHGQFGVTERLGVDTDLS